MRKRFLSCLYRPPWLPLPPWLFFDFRLPFSLTMKPCVFHWRNALPESSQVFCRVFLHSSSQPDPAKPSFPPRRGKKRFPLYESRVYFHPLSNFLSPSPQLAGKSSPKYVLLSIRYVGPILSTRSPSEVRFVPRTSSLFLRGGLVTARLVAFHRIMFPEYPPFLTLGGLSILFFPKMVSF